MTGGTIVLIFVCVYVVVSTLEVILHALFPKKMKEMGLDKPNSPSEDLMNQRVSQTGVRVGAVLDAVNANARGRKPTTWR